MINSIINILNLKADDIESITPSSTSTNENYHITLKLKEHFCPRCKTMTKKIKDYSLREIKQKTFVSFDTVIYYRARRLVCPNCGKTFMENNPFSNKRRSISDVDIRNILIDLKPFNSTFSSVAMKYNISITKVIEIFDTYIKMERLKLSKVICIDEFYFNRKAKDKYAFMIMDFETNTILDILKSRRKNYLSDYFFNLNQEELNTVNIVIMDMYRPYKEIANTYFKNAIIAVDSFHLKKMINESLDTIRKRVMNAASKSDNIVGYKLLKNKFKLLFKSYDSVNLTKRYYNKTLKRFISEYELLDYILDLDTDLKKAYFLKEQFDTFNNSNEKEYNAVAKKEQLSILINDLLESNINEMIKVGKTFKNWKNEILNSFTWINGRRVSNGPIEGKNNYIKKMIGNANGFNNFERARNKFMYSQNKKENIKYSTSEKKIKRKGATRGVYKKK